MRKMIRYWILLLFISGVLSLQFACENHTPERDVEQEKRNETRTRTEQTEKTEGFSMERYAWKNRPLLIFAPSPEDDRYREQKKMVERSREGFRKRDMVLIRVFATDGRSKAGNRKLQPAEAEQLRRQYDVHPDSFAVLLVGKDTGVKRRTTGPVDIQKIFEQIDRMPMRRREMERQSEEENEG